MTGHNSRSSPYLTTRSLERKRLLPGYSHLEVVGNAQIGCFYARGHCIEKGIGVLCLARGLGLEHPEVFIEVGGTVSQAARDVRIATGVNVVQRLHKAPGGLLRAVSEVKDGRFESVSLSGDFFC